MSGLEDASAEKKLFSGMDNAFDIVNHANTLLMKHSKRFLILSLAIIVGIGGAAATALAQQGNTDAIVTLCYRNRTIKVPSYLAGRYLAKAGTTSGACGTVTNP